MGYVVGMLAAVLVFLAGMVISVLGIGWLGALLCTAGVGAGLLLLVRQPHSAGPGSGSAS
jgi:hypothetical protein